MALIECPECKKQISDKAENCPNCGFPIAKEKETFEKNLNDSVHKAEENTEPVKKTGFFKDKKVPFIPLLIGIMLFMIVLVPFTSNYRNYHSAMKLFEHEQYQESLDKFVKLNEYKDSKKMVEKCKYELSTDARFIKNLSKGLVERWEFTDEHPEKTPDVITQFSEIELKHIGEFSNKKFNNADLGKDAKEYINSLKEAEAAAKYFQVDQITFQKKWNEAFEKRILLLKKFVDKNELKIDQKYQERLNELLTAAGAKQEEVNAKDRVQAMTKEFKINEATDEYGFKSYKINMKNTTDKTFDYFSVDISLEDQTGKIVGNGNSAQVQAWKPGQEAEADVWFSNDINPHNYNIKYIPHYQAGTYHE